MTEKRLLALIALLIGLVGGLLILNEAVRGFRGVSDLAAILSALVPLVLGIAILAASLLIYRSKYGSGGLLDIILGVVALILQLNQIGAILAIVAGPARLWVVEPVADSSRPRAARDRCQIRGPMNCQTTSPRIRNAKARLTFVTIRSRCSVEMPFRIRERSPSTPSLKM